mmetsp:Transcript_11348/g.31660  ORF Transcript_11348/g.31660 Transcript_11348/m.31660 type:complete len:130 (+) Transcript_11348:1257-1646(+)
MTSPRACAGASEIEEAGNVDALRLITCDPKMAVCGAKIPPGAADAREEKSWNTPAPSVGEGVATHPGTHRSGEASEGGACWLAHASDRCMNPRDWLRSAGAVSSSLAPLTLDGSEATSMNVFLTRSGTP